MIYKGIFPQKRIMMDKFPFFQPQPVFLAQRLPAQWKSNWHDRELWVTQLIQQ